MRRLSERRGRKQNLRHRNLCRDETGHRQLALGGRAVLHPHGQAAGCAHEGNRHPLQARALFRETPVEALKSDWLVLRIQPDEGICFHFNAKEPGPEMVLESVGMNFNYKDWFKSAPAVGYETLLYDVFMGDGTLFQRADQVEAA